MWGHDGNNDLTGDGAAAGSKEKAGVACGVCGGTVWRDCVEELAACQLGSSSPRVGDVLAK